MLPRPGSLSTPIVPPIRPTSRAAMVRPNPVPPYLRVVRAVRLLEGPEDPLPPVGRDADAGVGHREAEDGLPLGRGAVGDFHPHGHLALLGELDRVADQVEQHLPQPARVADQGVGHVRLHVAGQLQPLGPGPHGQGPHGVAQRRPEREVGRVQLQLAGLDLREVEQVVDEAEEAVGRRLDRLQALPLVVGQRGVEDQLGHAEDGAEGGADLVADVGQELVLGPVRRLRRLLGLAQLRLEPLALGDVLEDRDGVGGPAGVVALEGDGLVDPDDRAIPADVPLLELVAGEPPAPQRLVPIAPRRQVLGVGDVMEGEGRQLVAAVADDVAVLLVDAQEATPGVLEGDADGGVLERAAEPLLALAERLLGPPCAR